jgi:hypothetical protein
MPPHTPLTARPTVFHTRGPRRAPPKEAVPARPQGCFWYIPALSGPSYASSWCGRCCETAVLFRLSHAAGFATLVQGRPGDSTQEAELDENSAPSSIPTSSAFGDARRC